MNLEMLDGFLAALICGPDTVLPSEYLPEIWGGDDADEPVFERKSALQEFLSLIMRHWNATGHVLQSGDAFLRFFWMMRTVRLMPTIGLPALSAEWA